MQKWKSTLSKTLSSSQQFKESQSIYAETKETIGSQGIFNGQRTFVIDTPGLQDGSGLDTPHLVQKKNQIQIYKLLFINIYYFILF